MPIITQHKAFAYRLLAMIILHDDMLIDAHTCALPHYGTSACFIYDAIFISTYFGVP